MQDALEPLTAALLRRDDARQSLARDLAAVKGAEDVYPALCRITDDYYQMFVDEPLMRDIWTATQADRALQALDAEDGAYLSGLLSDALRPLAPGIPATALSAFAELTMTLIAAAVRHAILLEPREARRVLALFKKLLPRDLSALS